MSIPHERSFDADARRAATEADGSDAMLRHGVLRTTTAAHLLIGLESA